MSTESSSSDAASLTPSAAARLDSRSKFGWLAMLVVLWPIVMAFCCAVVGFLIGRMTPAGVAAELWNPRNGAVAGAAVGAGIGVPLGFYHANKVRTRLNSIHLQREQLRAEIQKRRAALEQPRPLV